jgi:AhpD family alkylhydroperoxidase
MGLVRSSSSRVGSTLEHVAWESSLIEPSSDRELEAYARRKQGMPNPSVRYFASVPWLARALVDLHPEYGLLIHLDQDVADLISLVVSQENSCRFCYAAVRAMLWSRGMSLERIQRVEHDLTRADMPPRTMAALAFGRSQSRSGPAAARAARKALQEAGFGVDEMKEIAYAVGATDFSNRAITITAVPARAIERLPERFHIRLLRPLLGRLLLSRHARGRATPLDRVPSHPYSGLVKAYAGSPIALALGRTLEEMWASPHLTRRCKLLMIAVIARGLGCQVCGGEVGEALQQEGLTEAAVAQVLTHLDAPELDAVERLLVPFARETIWYEPAPLQRRARALLDHLSGPQVLEAIGVAALANGLCRMGAVVFCEP